MTTPVPQKKVRSGHCGVGHHEGTRPKSAAGIAIKTCDQLSWCSCKCHIEIDRLYEGRERILKTNPEYKRPERTWWMPTFEDLGTIHAAIATIKFEGEEEPVFAETASGRIPRGQLEYWVKEEIDKWKTEEDKPVMSPAEISSRIQVSKDLPTAPSQGAVHAVLMRWEKINYAMIGRTPVRFQGLTVEGMRSGLDQLKAEAALKDKRTLNQ